MRPPEEMLSVSECSYNIGCPEARESAHKSVEQSGREPISPLDVAEPHAFSSARRAAATRSFAAPNAAEMMISNS